jgi:hypothetical protein
MKHRNLILAGLGVAMVLVAGCFVCLVASPSQPAAPQQPAPTNTRTIRNTSTPRLALPTATETKEPTSSPQPIQIIQPTLAAIPTSAPVKQAPTVAIVNPPAPAPCNCSAGDYNCPDFKTQREAQACFDFCGGSATNNVFKLDGTDHDGKVCETLP